MNPPLPIDGVLPPDLQGTLIRIGPGMPATEQTTVRRTAGPAEGGAGAGGRARSTPSRYGTVPPSPTSPRPLRPMPTSSGTPGRSWPWPSPACPNSSPACSNPRSSRGASASPSPRTSVGMPPPVVGSSSASNRAPRLLPRSCGSANGTPRERWCTTVRSSWNGPPGSTTSASRRPHRLHRVADRVLRGPLRGRQRPGRDRMEPRRPPSPSGGIRVRRAGSACSRRRRRCRRVGRRPPAGGRRALGPPRSVPGHPRAPRPGRRRHGASSSTSAATRCPRRANRSTSIRRSWARRESG